MNVLFTLVVFAGAASWALLVYRRLISLRHQVMLAWQRLDADQSNEAVKTVYNNHVVIYNDALERFPANIVAMAAGLKPARRF